MNDCISVPASGLDDVVTPDTLPESRTARHSGALLPGWLLPRWAFDSSGFGSAGATKPDGGPPFAAPDCAPNVKLRGPEPVWSSWWMARPFWCSLAPKLPSMRKKPRTRAEERSSKPDRDPNQARSAGSHLLVDGKAAQVWTMQPFGNSE